MISIRNEAFRYTFKEPIAALFHITSIDGDPVETAEGPAQLVNISTGGMKLSSVLNIPDVENKTISITISFTLNGKQLAYEGNIIWSEQNGQTTDYGIDLAMDESAETDLVAQLKIYAKRISKPT